MSTREMSAAMEAALEADIIYPIYFFEIGFASDTLRFWTGFGDFDWNGETWSGVGWILGFSETEETAETRATTFTIGSPATTALVAAALANFRKNRPVTIWQGLKAADGSLIEDPIVIAAGFTDISEIDTNPESPRIRIRCETRITDLERARVRRYTHEDHQIDHPGDLFFQFAAQVDGVLTWGKGG